MAEYWGLEAIGQRLGGISQSTVRRWYFDRGLLMYQRRPTGSRYHTPGAGRGREQWYTNDQLLLAWEIAYAREWREQVWSAGRKQKPTLQDQSPAMQQIPSPPDVVPNTEETS